MSHKIILPAGGIDLGETLDCGQAFRFAPLPDGSWIGIVSDKPCRITLSGEEFIIDCECSDQVCTGFWSDYFDISRDYKALTQRLCEDDTLNKAVAFCPGIRVLRQEPFETLCSFIISQNNNIPRIKGIITRFCETFGAELSGKGYSFPTPDSIAGKTPEDLAPLRAGFRAKYLIDAANRVVSGEIDLASMRIMPYDTAREKLMLIKGVGPKVADCVLLYGLGHVESLPKDVWIKRALSVLYPGGFPEELSDIAGIAQQFLFHYCRKCPGALSLSEPNAPALV